MHYAQSKHDALGRFASTYGPPSVEAGILF